MIVDCAQYVNGSRRAEPVELEHALRTQPKPGEFIWIGLHDPDADEFARVAEAFDLDPLAVEDATWPHQRPKLERYDHTLFVVFKPARYVDEHEVVRIDQIMVFLGESFVVSVRHGAATPLGGVRERLDTSPELVEWGPGSVLYAIADRIVDDYGHVMVGLEQDIDQIESEVFSEPKASHSERVFKLKREVLEFRRAVDPLGAPLDALVRGVRPVDPASSRHFRDVHDHLLRVAEQLSNLDTLLDSALHANVAQVGIRQNEDMRKMSAWVAIAAVPTMLAGVWGMNFRHMPELDWQFGYPLALLLMAAVAGLLYRNFKHRDWL